ncbi:hypothetical protein GOV05_02270 [Candidatus Woesearchaeota archaeon]|nr:hypothetical protein [Candidatus Woesearchaeota archaeon]
MTDFDEIIRIQRHMQRRLSDEKKMEDTVEVLMVINEVAPDPEQRIHKETVMVEAGIRGYSEGYVEKILDQLIRDNVLFVPAPGYLKRR